MNIETLNNMGVINSFTQNNGIGTPARMPYPESWKKEAEAGEQTSAPGKAIHLKSGGGRKIKMLRLLVAMHEAGFFVDDAGAPVDQQDVFAAFAGILGMGLSRANSNISDSLHRHNKQIRLQVFDDLKQADTCVLVLPCGRSAHTEAGWMAGAGKRVIVYIPEMVKPELMYKLFDEVVGNLDDLVASFNYDGEIQG